MIPSTEMKELFVKYIKRECSQDEVDQIIEYFIASKDLSDVPTIQSVYKLLDEYPDMENIVANRIHDDILEISKKKTRKSVKTRNYIWRYAAAAILVGILATGYFFRNNFFNNNIESTTPIMVNTNTIKPGTDKATLTLGDGSLVVLENGNTFQTQNASSNGEKIVYEAIEKKSFPIASFPI